MSAPRRLPPGSSLGADDEEFHATVLRVACLGVVLAERLGLALADRLQRNRDASGLKRADDRRSPTVAEVLVVRCASGRVGVSDDL